MNLEEAKKLIPEKSTVKLAGCEYLFYGIEYGPGDTVFIRIYDEPPSDHTDLWNIKDVKLIKVRTKYLIRVQANHDCFISDIEGDPGRTLLKENARLFNSKSSAESKKEMYAKLYPNRAFSVEKA